LRRGNPAVCVRHGRRGRASATGRLAYQVGSAGPCGDFAVRKRRRPRQTPASGSDALDLDYLRALRALAERVQPAWLSDHLCFTGVDGHHLHDLLPLPLTEAALRPVVARIARVQDFLGRHIAVENVSSYLRFAADEMAEHEFVAEVVRRADCRLLLDINNVWVNSVNHGFDPCAYIDALPAERVLQYHLAGHSVRADGFLVDTHDAPVCAAVWSLYRHALRRIGPRPTMIERDDHIPPLPALLAELEIARRIAAEVAAEVQALA